MTLNKVFKKKMMIRHRWDTFCYIYGPKNPHKKLDRKIARKRMKQDKFYNGFYEFLEENIKNGSDKEIWK